jgi:ABC-type nitrate/sulfonate/bicarbonate transport system substrate-binding protein
MKKIITTLTLTLTLLLSACASAPSAPVSPAPAPEGELRPVTLVLDYLPNTNHTGFYVAQALGYYEDAGLAVEIIEPADNTVTTLIATERGDFGVSYQEDVTYALTAPEPLPIKAIATIIQHNTSGFASYKDKNIIRPRDFEGKVYAGWGAPSEEAVIKAVMTADGADFSQLTIISGDGSGYAALPDKVDICWVFWAWDGIAAELDGVPLNYLELQDFDERLDYYTPLIIASDNLLATDPELARSFLAATQLGYEYTVENPVAAATILSDHVVSYDLEMLTLSQEYLAPRYIDGAPSWGLMRDEVWDNYTAFMRENGLITQDIAAADCYTNEFLPGT